MKNIILGSLAFILTIVTANAQTQNQHEKHAGDINYVVLTRKVPQLKPILLAAQELSVQDGKDFGDFQVVICGQGVKDLTDPKLMDDFLKKAESTGVIINACGFSLKKFGVKKESLPQQVRVVENGILHNFELQKKGYLSIEL